MLYADASALVRAYLPDEPDAAGLRRLVLETDARVVTSELARVELAAALRGAIRAGRIRAAEAALSDLDARFGGDGPSGFIPLEPERVLPRAYDLVLEHRLRTLDAVHLAVALEQAPELAEDDELVFVTRDADQTRAARKLGLKVQ